MAALGRYLGRGLATGAVGGVAFGLFVALVADPLVAAAEAFETDHGHGGGLVADSVVSATSVLGGDVLDRPHLGVSGGVVLGLLLGAVVFGLVFYVLEPAVPGRGAVPSYLLGVAGFVTVSGGPWLVFPPQPPGVEHALATDVRIAWYAAMMVAGALACGLAVAASRRLGRRHSTLGLVGALAALALVPAVAALAPANPVSGGPPADFVATYRVTVVAGQAGLWVALASTHAWLCRRDPDPPTAADLAAVGD
jgi:predicted cobalt transporter CbtA